MKFKEFLNFIRSKLEEKDSAREELLKLVREMRINSTKAISSIHSGNLEKAEMFLKNAVNIMKKIKDFRIYPDIYYPATFDAMQELVEAYVFIHVVKEGNLNFDLSELDLEFAPILTGLADSVGEMRRYVLDLLRKKEFEKAENVMEIMEEIYNELVTFNFPNRITPNLRTKVDYIRSAIEKTKSDFISAKASALSEDLKKFEDFLKMKR